MADAPQTITAEKLCALTGLSDRRHRQLAREGYFPPPIDSVYQLGPTITGMFRYYREIGQRRSGTQAELKEEKLRWETELLQTKVAREKRKAVDKAEVDRLLLHLGTRIKTILYERLETEAPPKLDGLPASAQRPILRSMADEVIDEMADIIDKFEDA